MPLSIQHISSVQRSVAIPFEGETLNVTYKIASLNPDLDEWVAEHREDRTLLMGWVEQVVTRWDIMNGDEAIPITVKAMEEYAIATPILGLILNAVLEDSSAPNLKKSYSASARSASAASRNGTKSS